MVFKYEFVKKIYDFLIFNGEFISHFDLIGIVDYCKRYADGAYNVQKETFKPIPVQYDVETAEKIQTEYDASIPLDKIPDKRKWRDARLANLAKMKKQLEDKNS